MNKKAFQFLSAIEVFLLSPDKKQILLMHRNKNRDLLPNYYSGIGGKMDSNDKENPLETAYREILEESSYKKSELKNLTLKGLITVYDRWGKWLVFEFVGIVKKKKFEKKLVPHEGVLEWFNFSQLKNLNLIQDLRNNVLEKIIFTKNFLWMKSIFNQRDKLIKFEMNEITK